MPSRQLATITPRQIQLSTPERRARNVTSFGNMVILMTIVAIGIWGALVPLASAVVSQGQLVVAGKRKQVQHRDGGVVAELLVKDGSVVKSGDLLIRLDTEEAAMNAKLMRAKVSATESQLAIINEELDIVSRLHKQGYASKRRFLNVQGRAAQVEGQRSQDLLRLRTAEHKIAHSEIKAPVSGTVVGMRAHTIGGVIAAGETALEIVPSADKLVVEARVQPTDVDDLELGLEADVRFSAFKQRTTPTLKGRVIHISADVLGDEATGLPYYKTLITVDKQELVRAGNLKLQPGMPAEVVIETAPRTVLTYLLQPLLDSTNRAMREQ